MSNLADMRRIMRDALRERGVPADIVDRATDQGFDPRDEAKYRELLLSCFGRLYCLQTVGRSVAELLSIVLQEQSLTEPRNTRHDVSNLATEGIAPIPALLSSTQVEQCLSWFRNRPCFNGHTPEASKDRPIHRFVGHTANQFAFGSYSIIDVVTAPHLVEAILSPGILGAAADHLGCIPTLSQLQAWWNFPGHDENVVPGGYEPRYYHRDLNDMRMFWVYMYLTPVDQGSGPHMVIRNSADLATIDGALSEGAKRYPALAGPISGLRAEDFFYQYGYQIPREVIDNIFTELEVTITGPPGTTFFSNGFNFHRIKYPLERPRLMFAARFSINPSLYAGPNRDGDPVPGDLISGRVGSSDELRYVTRKLFNWEERTA
jgi:hypothetical protein